MQHYDLALIGFGGVARALADVIANDSRRLTEELGYTLRVVAITDLNLGSLVQADGIELTTVLALPRGETFAGMPGGSAIADNETVIRTSSADIVVEATFTNPTTGQPALDHVRWALASGKHVITTNKGPVALASKELLTQAASAGLCFEFEGAVMSGTPVLRFAQQMLAGSQITSIQGILNGTSNFVLGRVGDGLSLEEAVAEAQELGFAEADPTADIGGSDVQLKVAILAEHLMSGSIAASAIRTTGITDITPDDIASAKTAGKVWKLLGSIDRLDDGSLDARVEPVALDAHHPLAAISGATNAVTFTTTMLGQVTVSGPGAGRTETAYALLSDITAIHTHGGDR